jgi:acetylornithine deacetylase/succinyl-diaminopimelate desuccinylase-like protein
MLANHAADIDAEFVLDEGGLGTRDIFRQGKLVYGISVAEKQPLWIRLRATGTAAHGSQPIPENANMILYTALARALALPEGGKANDVVEAMRKASGGEFAAGKFTAAIQRNTMTLTTLRSGVGDPPKVNVIPSTAEATIDCRLLPGTNADEFISELKARINDPRVTVELTNTPPGDPGTSNYETGLFGVLRQVILKYHPEAEVTPMLVPYSTDSTKFRHKGLPAYGFTPLVLPGQILATMHSDAERIPLDQFYTGVRMMFDVVRSEF